MGPRSGLLRQTTLPQEQSQQWQQWQDAEDEEEPALYATDDFRIRVMKVLRCSKKYCHDWTKCPFAHPGEKATRRDPTLGVYTGIACPDMRSSQRCPRGHYCPYAHNVFEYWLHPTRYRTALCRDVDKCTRKICFFAHNMQDLRTNLERPYVSPEQLHSAKIRAEADPRVQAKFLAAGEQKGSGRGNMFNGMDMDVGQSADQLFPVPDIGSLSLAAPPSTSQRADAMDAFSSIIRGIPDTSAQLPQQMPPAQPELDVAVSSVTGLRQDRSSGMPSSESGAEVKDSRSAFGAQQENQQNQDPNRSSVDQPNLTFKKAFQNQPKPVRSHPPSAIAHSWGSQQNLANATAHLTEDRFGKESSLWSTPRDPLDFNYNHALYSSASTYSERNPSIEPMYQNPSNRSADTRFNNPTRPRKGKVTAKRQSSASLGHASLSSIAPSALLTGSGVLTGASFPGQLYTGSSASTFGLMPDPGVNAHPALYTDSLYSTSLNSDYTQMLRDQYALQQQQQQQQQQQDFLSQQNVQVQYEQQQQLRARFPNAFGLGAPHPPTPFAEGLRQWEHVAQIPRPETGFDLRFGGLGENQGLLASPAVDPPTNTANMYSKLGTICPTPGTELGSILPREGSFQRPQPATSSSYPGSLDPSIIQALQAHGMRSGDLTAAPRRRSAEASGNRLAFDSDIAAKFGFSNAPSTH